MISIKDQAYPIEVVSQLLRILLEHGQFHLSKFQVRQTKMNIFINYSRLLSNFVHIVFYFVTYLPEPMLNNFPD